uniref:Uncharacterized protein n=1 Tax=Rhizophagus irregularis (strain DAOM 181602 / DAOM 197198 / MUCL 43194) TaxID=747089 RepID=U9UI93_RHIID
MTREYDSSINDHLHRSFLTDLVYTEQENINDLRALLHLRPNFAQTVTSYNWVDGVI